MRIPANKRHLIVNKEYSRLPYFTDDGYEEVQTSTSQKYIQDTYGKFAESENQQPYKGDEDYQALEYNYSTPQFPDNNSEVPVISTKPAGFCEGLWKKLFPGRTTTFVPTGADLKNLGEYMKKCPLLFVPTICCNGGKMKVTGPATIAVNGETSFSASGGKPDCAYRFTAEFGQFVGSKYFAPSYACTDTIKVTPWVGDDTGKECAETTITVGESTCAGTIVYGTLQMFTGGIQPLTVSTTAPGDVYTWSATSGSFDRTKGTSVVYTAPSTNANCASNPTITLYCNGVAKNTVTFAVNATSASTVAWYFTVTTLGTCICGGVRPTRLCYRSADGARKTITCAGTVSTSGTATDTQGATGDSDDDTLCAQAETNVKASLISLLRSGLYPVPAATWDTWLDNRTAEQKAAGCCPSQLL